MSATQSRRLGEAAPHDPAQCQSMAEVRAGVDALDRQIVALLGRRFEYMDAAARIKTDRQSVRDEARKAAVIANARRAAADLGLSDALVHALWEQLVEASIAHELVAFDAKRQPSADAAD